MASHKTLGFQTYDDYLKSDHWEGFKDRYRSSNLPKTCAVCGSKRIQLHHHTYERIGSESLEDVTPLCDRHHKWVHEWLDSNVKPVSCTLEAVEFVRSVDRKKPKRKKRKTFTEWQVEYLLEQSGVPIGRIRWEAERAERRDAEAAARKSPKAIERLAKTKAKKAAKKAEKATIAKV
jgi:hypothetical protein